MSRSPSERRGDSVSDDTADSAVDARTARVLDEYVGELERGAAAPIAEIVAGQDDLNDAERAELAAYLEGVRAIHSAVAAAETAPPRGAEFAASGVAPLDGGAKTLGDYTLVREIGRGGMGVVYEAEERSLRRRVALKVLPFAAVLDERQIARFRNEARAAAQLHHPHIVPVFAIGQDRGVHFYAMQHIEGRSLADAVAALRHGADFEAGGPVASGSEPTVDGVGGDADPSAAPISLESTISEGRGGRRFFDAAARIAADAADALQHAHDYGVVHRDVKPSNLLLDRNGKVWVTDFGLARAQTDLGVTRTGDVIGTLRYMSPEQASGGADRVDGRSDVYALGATLYELLTLRRAHLGADRRAMLDWLERTEPIRPRRHNPTIPADLENIVLRAMEKDASARYSSAGEMAEDLRRFLRGLPTVARPTSPARVVGKWLRRHRRVVSVAAAASIVVAVVSIAAAGVLLQANRRIASALRAEQAAKEKALEVVSRFGTELSDQLTVLPGSDTIREELVSDTLAFYRELAEEVGDHSDVAVATAVARLKAATIAERLGRPVRAKEAYGLAADAFRARLAAPRGAVRRTELVAWLARCEHSRGCLFRREGDVEAARRALDEAVRIRRELADASQRSAVARLDLAESLTSRALVDAARGERLAGQARLDEAIRLLRSARADADPPRRIGHQLAAAYNAQSLLLRRDAPQAALAANGEAVALLRAVVSEDPEEDARRADLAMCLNNRGAILGDRLEWDAAAAAYRESVAEHERLARRSPSAPRRRSELAIALSNRGMALSYAGETEASDAAFRRATATLADLVDDFPTDERYAMSLAALWNNRGVAARDAGRLSVAGRAFETAIALESRRLAAAPPGTPTLLPTHRANHAQVLQRIAQQRDNGGDPEGRVSLRRGEGSP